MVLLFVPRLNNTITQNKQYQHGITKLLQKIERQI